VATPHTLLRKKLESVWNGVIWIAGGITSAGFGTFTAATMTYNVAGDSYTAQGPLSTPIFGSVLGVSPPGSGPTANPLFFGTDA
jgi:hypothetical protein